MAYWDRYEQTKQILAKNKRVPLQQFVAKVSDMLGVHPKTIQGYVDNLVRNEYAHLETGFLVWDGEPKAQWTNAPPEGKKGGPIE